MADIIMWTHSQTKALGKLAPVGTLAATLDVEHGSVHYVAVYVNEVDQFGGRSAMIQED